MASSTHRTLPVARLERFAVPCGSEAPLLSLLRGAGWREVAIVSSDERTEVVVAGGPSRLDASSLVRCLAEHVGTSDAERAEVRGGGDVAGHLAVVAAGLDSRVVRRPAAHRHVVAARTASRRMGTWGPTLDAIWHAAEDAAEGCDHLGLPPRSLTRWAVAVGLSAVGRARSRARTAVLGAGPRADLLRRRISDCGSAPVMLPGRIAASDLLGLDLLVCVGGPGGRLTADTLAAAAARHPLTVVDLDLPRAVDPAAGDLRGVRLLDLDDLHGDEETAHREATAVAAARSLTRSRVACPAQAAPATAAR